MKYKPNQHRANFNIAEILYKEAAAFNPTLTADFHLHPNDDLEF